MVYGTPEQVRAKLQHYRDVTNANDLAAVFAFGSLRAEQVLRSTRLFRELTTRSRNPTRPLSQLSAWGSCLGIGPRRPGWPGGRRLV